MEYVIHRDRNKEIRVLDWVEVNGKLHPKSKKTVYFKKEDKPDFGLKDINCTNNIFTDESLRALRDDTGRG